jgi:hypothetical protein
MRRKRAAPYRIRARARVRQKDRNDKNSSHSQNKNNEIESNHSAIQFYPPLATFAFLILKLLLIVKQL